MKDKEEKTQDEHEADSERADDLRQEIRWDNIYLMIEAAETKARESLLADIEEWAKKQRRTDETQMSADHIYDEALDDLLALLESKRKK